MDGVKATLVTTGNLKGQGADGVPVTDEAIAAYQDQVNRCNQFFIDSICAGRKMPMDKVKELATGAIWGSADALKLGLVDAVQSFDEAFNSFADDLEKEANITTQTGAFQMSEEKKELKSADAPAAAAPAVNAQPKAEAKAETPEFIALADKYGLIPSKVSTTITVKADLTGYYDANRVLNSIAGKTVSAYVAVKTYGQGAVATGGYGGDVAAAIGLAGGGMARRAFSQGSLVDGPGTTTSDSVAAWLSRKEFVTRAAAVDYYGTDVMYAMNAKRIPREVFAQMGYADGGTPQYAYAPARLAGGGMASPTAPAGALGDTYNVNLEGREALQWVMTHLADGRRRTYQGEARHV